MKNVIVTGANSFIGCALLEELSKYHIPVWAVVRNHDSNINNIKTIPGVKIVYCQMENIGNIVNLINDHTVDTCFHLAWEGSSGNKRADYSLQLRNVQYALDTIHAMKELGVKRFIGIGTLAEKDVMNFITEDGAQPSDVSTYGIAKIATHYMTKTQCTKAGIAYIWCCLSNTYGIGNTTNNFVNMACKKMLNGERAAFTAGEQPYDFIYITDVARALVAIGERGKANTDYFIGSSQPKRLKDYIVTIRDSIDPEIPLFLGDVPFLGIPLDWNALSSQKLIDDTGIQMQVPFEIGIKETINWLKKQET